MSTRRTSPQTCHKTRGSAHGHITAATSTSTSTTTTTPTTTNWCYYWYPVGSPRGQEVQNLLKSKAPKLPKAAALRLEIKISLEKALRGGNWAKGRGTVLIQLP